jgi:hypothetical protein
MEAVVGRTGSFLDDNNRFYRLYAWHVVRNAELGIACGNIFCCAVTAHDVRTYPYPYHVRVPEGIAPSLEWVAAPRDPATVSTFLVVAQD